MISYQELEVWEERRRKNNFFELVFVIDGQGEQCVNGFQYPYKKDSIFLLPSTNCHSYEIKKKTKFLFIRFTTNYFSKSNSSAIDYSLWFNRLHFIIGNYNRFPGEIVKNSNDSKTLQLLGRIVHNEHQKEDRHSNSIIQSSLFSMLEIIARSIVKEFPNDSGTVDSKFGKLLNYIQFNLLEDEKITVKFLSDKFNIASSYFSEYFKRNANESFQDYVIKSKLKIAESKALYTDQSFKEIAHDLGFTDSSHLNRMMRKIHYRSLADVRKGKIFST
ncbi:AraC family transcriptional regulator [Flavobacterium soyangense]|uniref:Helix-turn-helix domain-containing protein n=1 Tax=Flavobacterium soyangense TaxID=2023265 RepID=A0A930UDI8_9FLAO|nr:AraC family transcriptional regulator [Flavobacterium soyangense]MBF2709434.1 helix-turn-helix domain-containing protein [Flavobacterium soyangense]